jgi:GAG-pre-integrase domain
MIFQDVIFKNVIGEGLIKNVLYYLDQAKFNFNIRREDQLSIIWHRRIGHPSNRVLKNIFNFSNLDNSSCETYKLGKLTRLPFNVSTSKVINLLI